MGIYRSQEGKNASLKLYDEQIEKLGVPYTDIYVDTSFGRTHLIDTGNKNGKPLLIFHGGNSTTSYNLLMFRFLIEDFHIYAVDIVGHPGKSAEVSLPHTGYAYGEWASEVIDAIGYSKISCLGASFGGGVLAKLLCVAPNKIERAVLIVPSGINNAFPIGSAKMMIPLVKYRLHGEDRYLIETAKYMALREEVIDSDTFDTLKDSFDNVKTKVGMPSNISAKKLCGYHSPTLVIAAEKDCLFPARKVLPRAKKIFENCETYMLENCGHMHIMPSEVKNMIKNFLLKQI